MRTLLLVVAVVCLALAIFYIAPGIPHPFTSNDTNHPSHPTHFIVFLVLAIISAIASRFVGARQQS